MAAGVDDAAPSGAPAAAGHADLDALKAQFVATVSHELRTPLTSICGWTELLREGALGDLPPRAAEAVDVVDRNTKRLLQLVDRLLLLSGVDDGSFVPRRAPVDVAALVATVTTAVRPAADEAGVRLVAPAPLGAPALDGDAVQLERLLLDLVSNAVKFSPDGGEVRVEVDVHSRPGHVLLQVSDEGMGIAEDDLPHLFVRFHRGRTAHEREIQGSGIGLSVAQEIARAHGGEITAASAPGRGSTFAVRLPAGT